MEQQYKYNFLAEHTFPEHSVPELSDAAINIALEWLFDRELPPDKKAPLKVFITDMFKQLGCACLYISEADKKAYPLKPFVKLCNELELAPKHEVVITKRAILYRPTPYSSEITKKYEWKRYRY